MSLLAPRDGPHQGLGRFRRMIEQAQEAVTIAVRQRSRHLLVEAQLILGYDPSLPDPDLRVAHLLDDNRGIGESLGKADPTLGISRSGFHIHASLFGLWGFPRTSRVARGSVVVNWEFP